jgi:hypothetical protein
MAVYRDVEIKEAVGVQTLRVVAFQPQNGDSIVMARDVNDGEFYALVSVVDGDTVTFYGVTGEDEAAVETQIDEYLDA